MLAKNETNHGFTCVACGMSVTPAPKTARNHCPRCLTSLHVDEHTPGDRMSACGGVMRAVDVRQKKRDEWSIVHECERCHKKLPNRTAPDDDFEAVLRLSVRLAAAKK